MKIFDINYSLAPNTSLKMGFINDLLRPVYKNPSMCVLHRTSAPLGWPLLGLLFSILLLPRSSSIR